MLLINSLQSEWLKTKRSAASWICLSGGFLLPLMFLIGLLKDHRTIDTLKGPLNPWLLYASDLWRFMGILLLPMGIVLAASLIAQSEYRNNTWKQLHASPQPYHIIFLAKFLTILLMTLQFFVYFNIGLLLSAVIPSLLFDGSTPAAELPWRTLLLMSGRFFICCLPVLALQYLFSMLFRNFLVPIGIGMAAVVGSLILIETWKYAWICPYGYSQLSVMAKVRDATPVNIYNCALLWFAVVLPLAYILYRNQKYKG